MKGIRPTADYPLYDQFPMSQALSARAWLAKLNTTARVSRIAHIFFIGIPPPFLNSVKTANEWVRSDSVSRPSVQFSSRAERKHELTVASHANRKARGYLVNIEAPLVTRAASAFLAAFQRPRAGYAWLTLRFKASRQARTTLSTSSPRSSATPRSSKDSWLGNVRASLRITTLGCSKVGDVSAR